MFSELSDSTEAVQGSRSAKTVGDNVLVGKFLRAGNAPIGRMQRFGQGIQPIRCFKHKDADEVLSVELRAHRSLASPEDFPHSADEGDAQASLNCDTDVVRPSAKTTISSTVARAESVAFCVATAPPVKSLIDRPT